MRYFVGETIFLPFLHCFDRNVMYVKWIHSLASTVLQIKIKALKWFGRGNEITSYLSHVMQLFF